MAKKPLQESSLFFCVFVVVVFIDLMCGCIRYTDQKQIFSKSAHFTGSGTDKTDTQLWFSQDLRWNGT